MWSVERFAVSVSVCVHVCLCMGGRLQLVTRGYGKHGSNFLPFSGPSVGYIEFLFWDHWETAVLSQILAGRSQEVTGANFCQLAAPLPPIEFLFWDHWEKAVLGQILGHGSGEVKLRSSTESSIRWGSEQDSLQGDER